MPPPPSPELERGGDRRPLRVFFVPFPTPGHSLPMADLAVLFAARGVESTLILTPHHAARLAGPILRAAAAGLPLRIHHLPFPYDAGADLPPGVESVDELPTRRLSGSFATAVSNLAPLFAALLKKDPPDAVVADALVPWTAAIAADAGIPQYAFTGTGCFALSVLHSIAVNRPQDAVNSGDGEPFLIPGLPEQFRLTRPKLPETTLPNADPDVVNRWLADGTGGTAGWVVNTFTGLEKQYIDYYGKATAKPVFAVGPMCLASPEAAVDRGGAGDATVINWLDSKPAMSVVYVCFGSLTRFPEEQLRELGEGLAASGESFVWVVPRTAAAGVVDAAEAAAGGRGMVVRGWSPQLAVLRHPAVGVFLTHCGWGAVTEALAAGVVALTWPVFAEQFFNELLVVDVAGVGVKVGVERGYVWSSEDAGGVVVGRRQVAERVRWAMGESEEVKSVRRRAVEAGEKARSAMADGGSSYEGLSELIDDIRRRRRRPPATERTSASAESA